MAAPFRPMASGSATPVFGARTVRPTTARHLALGRAAHRNSATPEVQHSTLGRRQVSPLAVPPRTDSGAWLARYAELQSSLFFALARPLGLGGAGGRDAF